MTTTRYLVDPQPSIPDGVLDVAVKSEAEGRVWYIQSDKDGINRWVELHRQGEMPEPMIQESKPDAIEYWREVHPWHGLWSEVGLEAGLDGKWYWTVGGEDLRFTIAPEEMPQVGDKYFLDGRRIEVRALVDDKVVYRRWNGNHYEYYVAHAWMFKRSSGLAQRIDYEYKAGKGLVEMKKDILSATQERVLRQLAATDDWMTAEQLDCQMSTLYSLSSRRNYVTRDVMRDEDIDNPRSSIHWQISTVGREVVAKLDM